MELICECDPKLPVSIDRDGQVAPAVLERIADQIIENAQQHTLIGKQHQLSLAALKNDRSALIAVIVIVMNDRFLKN